MKTRNAQQLIKDYDICLVDGNKLAVRSGRPTANEIEEIKSKKEEIIQYFKDIEDSKNQRRIKIENIEGLNELQKAINEYENYLYKKEKAFDNEFTSSVSKSYDGTNATELKNKYPRASAYILAYSWSMSNNYHKVALGNEALDIIINNGNCEQAIKTMNEKWSMYCTKNID
jgi:hypothetical protein